MRIFQVVRRFGPVGGMESYVWYLSKELANLGCSVTVLCEEDLSQSQGPFQNLNIISLPRAATRPRWLALLKFSMRVRRYIRKHVACDSIVHSHERTNVHEITTFHGPPFAHIRTKSLWKRLSIRVSAHLWLEKRELLGRQVRFVVPNSLAIKNELLRYYPSVNSRLSDPIPPGVLSNIPSRGARPVDPLGGVIGFVGKEWKRKGLSRALAIYQALKARRPQLKMMILGVDQQVVSNLDNAKDNAVQARGWQDAKPFYQQMDLLLHPANHEPFGMVVIEAMAARVPVLISSNCGASEYVTGDHGAVLNLQENDGAWAEACDLQLRRVSIPPGFSRGWDVVAKEYLDLYLKLRPGSISS